jgi:hypothetical protein
MQGARQVTAEYWCPNDEIQNRALDIAHHFATLLLGGLFEALIPVATLSNLVDIGTGNGHMGWPMTTQPHRLLARILALFQPDAQRQWTSTPESFSYVHLRRLCGRNNDWPELYRQAYCALTPG